MATTTELRSSATISFEEFLKLNLPEGIRAEWVDGRVEFLSPVNIAHESVARWLLRLLSEFTEYHGIGRILMAPFLMRLDVRPSGREPDIIFVATENLERLKDTYLDGPGDLVVEVISRESIGRDRGDKYSEYEQAGIREYWLLDPIRKQAEFYRLGEDGIYRLDPLENGVFRSDVMSGLWLKVDWLWSDPRPKLRTVLEEWGIR